MTPRAGPHRRGYTAARPGIRFPFPVEARVLALLWLGLGCPPTPEDSATEAASPPNGCGPWTAIVADRRWDYAYDADNDVTGDWSTTVKHFRDGTGTLETVSHTKVGAVTEDATTRTTFTCDGGLVLTSSERQWAGINAGASYNGASATTYTEPARTWPRDVATGDSWDVHFVGSTLSNDVRTAFDYTDTYTVNAPSEVSVDAGDFRAFRVAITSDAGGVGTPSNVWVASGTGVVQGDGYSLIAVQ